MQIEAHLGVEVVALESEDAATVILDLAAPQPEREPGRRPRAVVVVLDCSAYMSSAEFYGVKLVVENLLDRLDPMDFFGLVAFDDHARVMIPTGLVGKFDKRNERGVIADLGHGGLANLESGYVRGLLEAKRVSAEGGTTLIVISGGCPQLGRADPAHFRALAAVAAADSVTTSTIGIGTWGQKSEILSALALGGGGKHEYVTGDGAAVAAIESQVEGLLDKSVLSASLLMKPTCDVLSMGVADSLSVRRVEGGLLAELGDFLPGEQRRLLLDFQVPDLAARGLTQVATCELNYVVAPAMIAQKVTVPIMVNVIPQDLIEGRVGGIVVEQEGLTKRAQDVEHEVDAPQERVGLDGDRDRAGAVVETWEVDAPSN